MSLKRLCIMFITYVVHSSDEIINKPSTHQRSKPIPWCIQSLVFQSFHPLALAHRTLLEASLWEELQVVQMGKCICTTCTLVKPVPVTHNTYKWQFSSERLNILTIEMGEWNASHKSQGASVEIVVCVGCPSLHKAEKQVRDLMLPP